MADKINITAESTYLEPAIKAKQDLVNWILVSLGHPLITVELTEAQFDLCIQNALERYTKYASFDIEDIVVDLKDYVKGVGIDLSQYHIADIRDISFPRDFLMYGYGDLFFGMPALLQSYAQGGVFPGFNQNNGLTRGSWVGLHNLHENLELIGRMTGSMPQYRYYKSTKLLKLIPEPKFKGENENILITAETEPPLEELYGNEYVKRLVLAQAKMLLGTIRKKFSSVQLVGGGQLDTAIGDEGKEEWDKLNEQLLSNESFGSMFIVG